MTLSFTRAGSALAATLLLSSLGSAQTVDIFEIIVLRENPAAGPNPTPYAIEIIVEGSGIFSASIEAKGGTRGPVFLLPGDEPGAFVYESFHADALDLRQAWPTGPYQLVINQGALVLDVQHAPLEPLRPTTILAPTPGDRCAQLPLDLRWADCSTCGGNVIYVELEQGDGSALVYEILPATDTSWSPPPGFLQPGTEYLGLVEIVNLDQQLFLPNGTEYISAFTLINEFEFQTAFEATETVVFGSPPNPFSLQPGLFGPPILGQVWAPWIDHSFFAPQASLDILALDLRPPINQPIAAGTLLLLPPPAGQLFLSAPGSPFQLPIPPDCGLAGLELMTQGISFTPQQGISLTNGLALRLGSQ